MEKVNQPSQEVHEATHVSYTWEPTSNGVKRAFPLTYSDFGPGRVPACIAIKTNPMGPPNRDPDPNQTLCVAERAQILRVVEMSKIPAIHWRFSGIRGRCASNTHVDGWCAWRHIGSMKIHILGNLHLYPPTGLLFWWAPGRRPGSGLIAASIWARR